VTLFKTNFHRTITDSEAKKIANAPIDATLTYEGTSVTIKFQHINRTMHRDNLPPLEEDAHGFPCIVATFENGGILSPLQNVSLHLIF
jgi:hypothetical protein